MKVGTRILSVAIGLSALFLIGNAFADAVNLKKLKANPHTAQLLGACQPQVDAWRAALKSVYGMPDRDMEILLTDYQKKKSVAEIQDDIRVVNMSLSYEKTPLSGIFPREIEQGNRDARVTAMNVRLCMSQAELDIAQGREPKPAGAVQAQGNAGPNGQQGKAAKVVESVNNCIRLVKPGQPGGGNFGALENVCAFAIDVRYCNEGTKSGSWAESMSCTEGGKNWGGSTSIQANKLSAAHIGGNHTYWFVCRKPAEVSDASFAKDQGIKARCK